MKDGLAALPEGPFVVTIRVKAEPVRGDLPCHVELDAELDEDAGTYVVTEIRCSRLRDGGDVTGEMLRSVPVQRILRAGALQANKLFQPSRADIAEVRAQGPTVENLRLAARIYRMAYFVRDNPTSAVSKALRLPYSTAARWVTRARRDGYLGPAHPRKAGEQRPQRRKG